MIKRIDDWLEEVGAESPDRSLHALETRVWAAIGERQRAPSAMMLWGWRSAAAAVLLTVGLLAQGASIAQARMPEFELFSPHAALAPSTLLGDSQ